MRTTILALTYCLFSAALLADEHPRQPQRPVVLLSPIAFQDVVLELASDADEPTRTEAGVIMLRIAELKKARGVPVTRELETRFFRFYLRAHADGNWDEQKPLLNINQRQALYEATWSRLEHAMADTKKDERRSLRQVRNRLQRLATLILRKGNKLQAQEEAQLIQAYVSLK